ncbi:hypothetical protein [Streptomyces kronopolitis]|uniref:hypothetical protein n=1 Tax=Streptomyces kronopolitis TaxID=1612435 RepID=UPI003D99A1C2
MTHDDLARLPAPGTAGTDAPAPDAAEVARSLHDAAEHAHPAARRAVHDPQNLFPFHPAGAGEEAGAADEPLDGGSGRVRGARCGRVRGTGHRPRPGSTLPPSAKQRPRRRAMTPP